MLCRISQNLFISYISIYLIFIRHFLNLLLCFPSSHPCEQPCPSECSGEAKDVLVCSLVQSSVVWCSATHCSAVQFIFVPKNNVWSKFMRQGKWCNRVLIVPVSGSVMMLWCNSLVHYTAVYPVQCSRFPMNTGGQKLEKAMHC